MLQDINNGFSFIVDRLHPPGPYFGMDDDDDTSDSESSEDGDSDNDDDDDHPGNMNNNAAMARPIILPNIHVCTGNSSDSSDMGECID